MKTTSVLSVEREPVTGASLAEIIANYQIDISCAKCAQRISRPISFVRGHATMLCPNCGALMLLDVSVIRQEVRRIEKQLGQLRQQLLAVLEKREPQSKGGETRTPPDTNDD